MGQEQYGTWAAGLDRTTAAKGLLAFGIVAAVDPSFAMTAADGLAERLRGVVDATQAVTGERSDQRGLPLVWADPLALAAWDPNGVRASATQWAEAFDSAHVRDRPIVRLAMTVAEASDLVWLSESFRPLMNSYAWTVSYEARQSTPWRFPLRIGFLADGDSRRLLADLVAGFAGSSWRSTLLDPFVLGPARISCDLLVLSSDPWGVPTRLLPMPEVRAGAVLVLGQNAVAPGLDKSLIDKITDITGAWAVVFANVTNIPSWLVGLVQSLSHATSFDFAVAEMTSGTAIIAADSSVIVREMADLRAIRLAQALNDLDPVVTRGHESPIRTVARRLAEIATTGEFISEAGDASMIAGLDMQAGRLLDQAGSTRRLLARITAANEPSVSLTAFQAATTHLIEVRVGPLENEQWLAAAAAFPEEALEPDRAHELTVVLTEPLLLTTPQIAMITLPVVGTSTSATFTLTTTADTMAIDARLIVLSGNRVLQTARLPAEVGEKPRARQRAVSESEVVIAPMTTTIADRRTFGAALVVNRNADGQPRATTIAGTSVGMVNLGSDTVSAALRKISTRLNEVVEAPNEFGAIDSVASVEMLVFLAFHGARMRTALVVDSPGLAQVLERPSKPLQVVSAKSDAYFPFELAYEFPSPRPGAALCPQAVATLRSDKMLCTAQHHPAVVCPTGFWGLHRVLERHAYQPEDQVTATFLLRSAPSRRRGVIKLGSAIFAASQRVDAVVPGGSDAVAHALGESGQYTRVALWDDWRAAVSTAPAPSLLMVMPHTAYDDRLEAFGLEIGADDVEYAFDGCIPSDEHPVIVVLLGCETARAGELSYETFPAQMRYAGAEVVIATLTEVLGRHASPIASRLAREISRQSSTDAHGMGEVMLTLRRNLLADGLLPVLALACFGDADWLVGI